MTNHKALVVMDMPWTCQKCREPWPCETEILRRRVSTLESAIKYDPDNVEILINGERVAMSTVEVLDTFEKNWIKIALADNTAVYSMARTIESSVKNFARMRISNENN